MVGEDLKIVCLSPRGDAISFTLRESDTNFQDPRLVRQGGNDTHRVFVLRDTRPSDHGRVFACAQAERVSNSVTVTIFCKFKNFKCLLKFTFFVTHEQCKKQTSCYPIEGPLFFLLATYSLANGVFLIA